MDSSSLVQQGIAALKSNDKATAIRLLTEAIKEDRSNVDAWLYLGAAIDDPSRKRQAFEQVLKLDPGNTKAKNALARLDAAPAPQAVPTAGKSASSAASTGQSLSALAEKIHFSFKLPVHIDGAPDPLTSEYCIEKGRERILQVWEIFRTQNSGGLISAGENATQWDYTFVVGIGVAAIAFSSVFYFIGTLFNGEMFRHFPISIFGVLLLTIFYVVISAGAAVGGFASAVFASEWYLKSQSITVTPSQHRMYLALAFLPFLLTSAVIGLFSNTFGGLLCLGFFTWLIPLAALAFSVYLLMKAFDQVYGGVEQNRGLITSAIAMAAGWFANGIALGIVFGIIKLILTAAFRL